MAADITKKYSDSEIESIYSLGRLMFENGDYQKAELIYKGLSIIAPNSKETWLGLALSQSQNNQTDEAIYSARQALRLDPEFTEASLYLITFLIKVQDFNTAGTYLGEIGEKLDTIGLSSNNRRFYHAQLARYKESLKS